ncbi:RsmB/NOP family class I SAM-dependent RNA methyltransferase [Bartonella sp. DGB2]|uniref:RsmB/NOP family class I SAM-dependent RNA methyltransferase n=1 Tax=Bartonella sp. DGB2 TaxID=3388426 RepID=UPI003990137F
MRLGGRLQAAIDILNDIKTRHRPAAEALKDWGLNHRFAGAHDRAAIGNIVYDTLRCQSSLCWRMDSQDYKDAAFGALLTGGGLTFSEIDAALHTDRFAPAALSTDRRNAWQSRLLDNAPPFIRADVPEWCTNALTESFGADWIEEGHALSERPPLDLRVNRLKGLGIISKISKALPYAAPIPWFSQTLRVAPIQKLERHPNVQTEAEFQKGYFEVQDLGSQIVARLVGAKAGMQVLDYCAGAGGKTLALAADMENRGQIHAYDADKARLAPIYDRLRRAGARNVQIHSTHAALDNLKGQMDLVLLDAPCTGSGTWRRRPDAKWRLSNNQLNQRIREQAQVLTSALPYLKEGGRLVYITCSLFPEENNHQIMYFLQQNPRFHALNLRPLWQEIIDHHAPHPTFIEQGLLLSPARTQSDGFFISILEKTV